jgi:hypothetical protein
VIDGAIGAGPVGPPRRTQRRAAQDERIDGHCGGAEEVRRRQQAPPHHGQVAEAHRRVVEI